MTQAAVEYYEWQHNPKYTVFKNKITRLLISPTVSRTISGCAPREPQGQHQESRKRSLEKNLSYAMQNTEGDVRSMLVNASDRRENVVRIVTNNLLEQEYAIRQRLSRRRKGKASSERESTEGDRRDGLDTESRGPRDQEDLEALEDLNLQGQQNPPPDTPKPVEGIRK